MLFASFQFLIIQRKLFSVTIMKTENNVKKFPSGGPRIKIPPLKRGQISGHRSTVVRGKYRMHDCIKL